MGAWNLGHCATDADCGPPVKHTDTRILNITQPCCATCAQNHEKLCDNSATRECDACTHSTPCYGYAISKTVAIDSAEGGVVALANGAGMAIPKDVWPEGVSDAWTSEMLWKVYRKAPISSLPMCAGAYLDVE